MTEKEKDMLRLERAELQQNYRLSDKSDENLARRDRIREISRLLGDDGMKPRKTWMDRRPPVVRNK